MRSPAPYAKMDAGLSWRVMAMVTIKEIARRAGVSHGTVANVLNGRGGVSMKEVLLVEQAGGELG